MRLTEPNFEDLIQNHTHCLSAEGRSQKTIDWYAANLKRFLQFLKNHDMPTSVKDIGIPEVRRFIHHLHSEVIRWEEKQRKELERQIEEQEARQRVLKNIKLSK